MPRQITTKSLNFKRKSPVSTTSSGIAKVPCAKCKRRQGPLRKAQNMKELRNNLSKTGILQESPANSGVVDDAHHILHALGIGCVYEVPIQPSPRSEDNTKIKIRSDFSLLKIETDKTVIPNMNIFDRKSMRLKRGETKFVSATKLIPFTESSAFYKPPDLMTPAEINRAAREINKVEKPNVTVVAYALFLQQQKLATKLMEPSFKIAMKKVGA